MADVKPLDGTATNAQATPPDCATTATQNGSDGLEGESRMFYDLDNPALPDSGLVEEGYIPALKRSLDTNDMSEDTPSSSKQPRNDSKCATSSRAMVLDITGGTDDGGGGGDDAPGEVATEMSPPPEVVPRGADHEKPGATAQNDSEVCNIKTSAGPSSSEDGHKDDVTLDGMIQKLTKHRFISVSDNELPEHHYKFVDDKSTFDPKTFSPVDPAAVLKYIKARGSTGCVGKDLTVLLMTSRVAQRSYGSEKRFLTPPPLIYLAGNGWETGCGDDKEAPEMRIGIEEDGSDAILIEPDDPDSKFAAAKHFYVNNSDGRKAFSFHLRLFYKKSKKYIGTFKSSTIKVISKPSRKQANKLSNVILRDGIEAVVFSRLRSRPTRFLHSKNGELCLTMSLWSSYRISILSKGTTKYDDDFLRYGYKVVLTCVLSGVASVPMILRHRTVGGYIENDHDTCVSDLQKVVFEMADTGTPYTYLKINENTMELEEGVHELNTDNDGKVTDIVHVSDNCVLAIISTTYVCYTFYEATGPAKARVTPIPLVNNIKVRNRKVMEIHGEQFSPSMCVFFGSTPAKTIYRCAELLFCEPPPLSAINKESFSVEEEPKKDGDASVSVPLLIVREDGIIYNLELHYTYPKSTSQYICPVIDYRKDNALRRSGR